MPRVVGEDMPDPGREPGGCIDCELEFGVGGVWVVPIWA
jgi:hypothetical protein